MSKVTPVTVREGRADSSALSNQSLALPGDMGNLQVNRNDAEFLMPVGTHWVEQDVLRISEEVDRITQGKCRVASCNCNNCERQGHFPHVVLELGKDGRTHPVFGFTQFGPHVVQRIREIHVSQNPNKKAMTENQRLLAERKQRTRDAQSEKLEIVKSALSSHKHNWRGPNGIRTRG